MGSCIYVSLLIIGLITAKILDSKFNIQKYDEIFWIVTIFGAILMFYIELKYNINLK